MEDFKGAQAARLEDLAALEAAQRTIFAMHTGGVVIECQMKALIAQYHKISEWNESGQRKRDPRHGQPIPNPGHGLIKALRLMDSMFKRAKTDSLFIQHLNRVMHPLGSTSEDFVAIRYCADGDQTTSAKEWQHSFKYVHGWLEKNKRSL